MPALMWIAAILFVIAIAGAFLWRIGKKFKAQWTKQAADLSSYTRENLAYKAQDAAAIARTGMSTTIICGALAAFLAFLSCFTVVPANQVGIVTLFGSWSGTVPNGLHFVIPWSKVDTFPTRNQKSIRDQADGNFPCVPVKLNGGAGACVDTVVLYTIDDRHAEQLWRGWGSFDKLNEDLINRSTDDAFGVVYGGYTAELAATGSSRPAITDAVSTLLRAKLAVSGVELGSVTLGDIHLPPDVQNRINAVLEQESKTKVAEGQKAEAAAQAEAARARQAGLTPEALINACIDAAREIKPAYFDCGLGAAASSRPSIILPPRQGG